MRLPSTRRRAQRSRQRGLSLIELVMFIVVVGVALAAVLRVFAQATAASADPQLQRQALAIAESLLEEVQLMPFTFCDPDDANLASASSTAGCASLTEAIGREGSEGRFSTPQFDNVNDYHGYQMSGIVDISNTAVPGLSGYSAQVTVQAASLGSLGAASGEVLRITVQVTGPAGTSATLDGYRTRHAPNAAL
ncbi:prepilin-type N-terminal cleavage/methylation domain-containing protein [Ideonella sp.]|uniref:prepilin-type N-terminal cleavage/methylation domain-containing protein n=1 Tax=Ideonella sp. TaxID=1929293 RepID=UPI003BB75F72